jgi:hypothetical protein
MSVVIDMSSISNISPTAEKANDRNDRLQTLSPLETASVIFDEVFRLWTKEKAD